MKFAFIEAEKATYPISILCQVLEVTRSGYYAWLRRGQSSWARTNDALGVRILAELKSQGHRVSRKRVARLMVEQGVRARVRCRWVPRTTDSRHGFPVAPNLLDRQFDRRAPDQAWVGDVTYVRTGEGWLYLATLLDLYSRKVVGWSMSDRIDRHLVLGALEMAILARKPAPGLIHHSDRGSQYASADYREALKSLGLEASMSRSWDNAIAESFFSTHKTELAGTYETHADARRAIFEYVEVFYNRKRRHSTIDYLTPVEFEAQFSRRSFQVA